MRKCIAVLCAAALLILAGCGPKAAVTTGAFDGQTYENEYFGLTLKLPAGWHVAQKNEVQAEFDVDQDQVGSDDKALEEALGIDEQKTLCLFYVTEYPLDHVGSFNANASLTCENLKLAGLKVKDPADYLGQAVEQLDPQRIKLEKDEIEEKKIGKTKVASMYVELEMAGTPMRQRYIAAIKNGYVLLLTLTYSPDSTTYEIAELQGIVDSMEFE